MVRKGDSNPHGSPRQILSLNLTTDSKQLQQPSSAESGKVLQNPQPQRNQEQQGPPTMSSSRSSRTSPSLIVAFPCAVGASGRLPSRGTTVNLQWTSADSVSSL